MRMKNWVSAAVLAAALGVGAVAWSADAPVAPTLPSTGPWGYDLDGRDLKTKPGDDFFRYANGTYQDNLVIPSDRSSFSPRSASAQLTEFRIREILETNAANAEAQPTTVEGKIGAYYASFMDEARVEKLGAAPMAADLRLIRDAKSRSALIRLQQLLHNVPIAIVSSRADAHTVALARTFGVSAYLSKSAPVSSLVPLPDCRAACCRCTAFRIVVLGSMLSVSPNSYGLGAATASTPVERCRVSCRPALLRPIEPSRSRSAR